MIPLVSFREKKLSVKEDRKITLDLRNNSHEPFSVRLKLVGSTAYRLAKKDLQFILKPGQEQAVPVEFHPATGTGWPIARNVKYKTTVQIWDDSGKHLIDTAVIQGRGASFVPVLHCLTTGIRPVKKEKSRSPPAIFLETVIPGTTISVNTGAIEVNWSVDGADNVDEVWGGPGMEVLPDNTATDWGEMGSPASSDHGSFSYTPGGTASFGISARNADGQASKTEVLYHAERIGYHDTHTPAGGSIYESELETVRRFLTSIEDAIRTNNLVHLADFMERWNAAAPEGYRFPAFDDMSYLTGPVGSGNLADDMLNAMRSVLVYLKPYTLPQGYRPGTITDPGLHALCDSYSCNGGTCTIYGKTIWHNTHPDRSWLGICLDIDADELTLLHELYHYTTHIDGPLEEQKAVAVSWCCFDEIPF